MYFLTTRAIENNLGVVIPRMTILSMDNVRTLAGQGVDSIPCIICQDMRAVDSATKDMMDGRY